MWPRGSAFTGASLQPRRARLHEVAGAGGGKEESVEEAKPWLVQEIPELTAKSHNDICFKGEGLCVIYLKDTVRSVPCLAFRCASVEVS